MNFNNFTIKAQEAIQQASEIAQGNQQQAIETAHLLKGLLTVDENAGRWPPSKTGRSPDRKTG